MPLRSCVLHIHFLAKQIHIICIKSSTRSEYSSHTMPPSSSSNATVGSSPTKIQFFADATYRPEPLPALRQSIQTPSPDRVETNKSSLSSTFYEAMGKEKVKKGSLAPLLKCVPRMYKLDKQQGTEEEKMMENLTCLAEILNAKGKR